MDAYTAASVVSLSARALSQAIHARRLSCREVMQAYLTQIQRLNPHVNALVSLREPETLLAEADARDALLTRGQSMGWMHGFPQAPKDLAATRDIVTTLGSPIFRHHQTAHDAIAVARMRRAGAIFVGKTNTPEFGLGSHTYNAVFGITRNAWNPRLSAGGSSGGAAVALALNLLPVADGSDMMGSLRNPAGWNNVYGLRPSMGRVPYGPTPDVFYQQLGTEGPMARNVEDLALLLAVQAGADARTPLALGDDPAQFTQSLAREFRGTRIGWLGDYDGYLPTEPGVMALCTAALRHFDDVGCSVEAVQPAFAPTRLWQCWLTLRAFLVAGTLAPLLADPTKRALLKPEAIWEAERGEALGAGDVMRATQERSAWYQALMQLFEHFDYLVLPTAQIFPFDAEQHWPQHVGGRDMDTYHRWMEVVIGATLAGLPALNVPAGFGPQGLPMGLQIIGKPRADFSVLQLGAAWQQATPFAQRHAPLLQ